MKTRLPVILVCCVAFAAIALAQNVRHAKQGFSMRLCFDNRGVIGRMAYPDFPNDSIGLEYPLGSACEHVFGGGLWVGGKLDTAQSGTSMPIRLVSTAYEGWSGPLFEFFPGNSVADTIWKVNDTIPAPTLRILTIQLMSAQRQ